MKWTRNILSLLVLFAFSVVELSAQTASSAAQVVTFGVRRIALQTPSASIVSNTTSRTVLKVTVGSQSRSQGAVELRTTTADQAFSSEKLAMNASVPDVRPVNAVHVSDLSYSGMPITNSVLSEKLFVTLTE